MQGPQQEVQWPQVNRKYVQGPHNMWPLHTAEAFAPLFVALAHIQVALAPISIYWICGPCTWPLHLENAPFQPSKRYIYFNQSQNSSRPAENTALFCDWLK